MSILMPTSNSGKYALKLARILVLGFIAAVSCTTLYQYFTRHEILFGQEVLYKQEFNSVVQVISLNATQHFWSECIVEKTTVRMTADTVILESGYGAIGFKPIDVDEHQGLLCSREDGEIISLFSVEIKKGVASLVLVQPEATLILTEGTECVTQEDLKK